MINPNMLAEPEEIYQHSWRQHIAMFWQRHRFYAGFAIGFAGGAGFMFIAMAFAILLGLSLDGGLG